MTILLALLIDWFIGEPPGRWHPVVWMGAFLNGTGRLLPDLPPRAAFICGAAAWIAGAAFFAGGFGAAAVALRHAPNWLAIPATALLLKPLFALRLLLDEVAGVEAALAQSLACGRERLSRLVSRDTAALPAADMREAALESLSENLSDSLVAPLFWFLLLGLPGAALYRFANTADAMWGYRGRWEWSGKFAARADDLLNFVPARVTALALLGAPRLRRLGVLRREAARTESPNAGWPMAAFALALGVRLGKPGVYELNAAAPAPQPATMHRGLALAGQAGLAIAGAAAAMEWAAGG